MDEEGLESGFRVGFGKEVGLRVFFFWRVEMRELEFKILGVISLDLEDLLYFV